MPMLMPRCRCRDFQMAVKKVVLKNFANFTEKHLYYSFFLIKLRDLGLQPYEKRDFNTGVLL